MADLGLLCVHPHPDDESIACGGVLARYVDEGMRVLVVTCTAGEEGENLAGIDLGGRDLVAIRADELAVALGELGVDQHASLGYRDSGMAGTPANDRPDSFARVDDSEAAERLAGIIRAFRPDVVVSDDASGTYGHPDHVKAHHVTVLAVRRAAAGAAPWRVRKRYVRALARERIERAHQALVARGLPSPFEDDAPDDGKVTFGTPLDRITTVVDVRAWLGRKRRAMAAHRSQMAADSFFLNVPPDLAQDLFGVEEFVLEEGKQAGSPEDDLFAGLRP